MCDTMVVTPEASADGVMLFGKNSDRAPNEAQHLAVVPAADHGSGSKVMCTYIKIDQVAHTHAVLLSKPFWIWGAEMGVNEHGLAIGNEAVFTRTAYEKAEGLIGMDLLRLALERASDARAAVEAITALLARHGQGGSCGYLRSFRYHNSFLMADPREAWVLETSGRHWAARRVKGIYTISNGITIEDEWDASSPDLVSEAVRRGWCRRRADFSFARCYSDRLRTGLCDAPGRAARSRSLLAAVAGRAAVTDVMAVLRDHGGSPRRPWPPDRRLVGATLCMHASAGPVRGSQTAGSLACRLPAGRPTCFATGTAAPCLSVFKPLWIDAGVPDLGPQPSGTYSEAALYGRQERFNRLVLRDYQSRSPVCRDEQEALERRFVAGALELAGRGREERLRFAQKCFADADAALRLWTERAAALPVRRRPAALYAAAWRAFDRQAGMPM